MASISTDKQGRRRILFVDPTSDEPNGERKMIRLGQVSKASAEEIRRRVRQLLEAKTLNQPMSGNLADWVANLLPPLAKKLARVGLIPKPEPKRAVTLGEHLTNYFARRTDVKANTLTNWRHTRRGLLAFFTAEPTPGRVLRPARPGISSVGCGRERPARIPMPSGMRPKGWPPTRFASGCPTRSNSLRMRCNAA